MYKLPISKYKNAAPKVIKREQILNGITTNRLANTIGSLINCNLKYITFALDSSSGGSVCTIRHDDLPRRLTFSNDSMCVTHAHSGPINDIQYNSFNQSVVATAGFDAQVQLWSIDDTESTIKLNSLASLALNENRCDSIQWNPNVDNILVSTSLNTIYLWDVQGNSGNSSAIRAHSEAIQGLSWKRDGSMLVTTAKDKSMQIIDPRNTSSSQNLRIENSKTANKDSKVVWIGTSDCILSSVYTQSFQREIHLWDIRNTSSPVHETSIDNGNNVLNPYYDYDTSVLFLYGKAETMVRYCEVFLNESNWSFSCNSSQPVDDQIKGVCMMPKFGLDLMKCEIDRLILLTRNSLYPLPYYIPRRSYYDFHSDVFPETYNIYEPGIEKSEWLKGQNSAPLKLQLNPDVQRKYLPSISVDSSSSNSVPSTPTSAQIKPGLTDSGLISSSSISVSNAATASTTSVASNSSIASNSSSSVSSLISNLNNKANETPKNDVTTPKPTPEPASTPASHPVVQFRSSANRQDAEKRSSNDSSKSSNSNGSNGNLNRVSNGNGHSNPQLLSTPSIDNRKSKVKSVYYQSKFKYINGKPAHKNEHITNIRNLSTMWPSECNGFQINSKHAAYLLAGSSGQIGVVELNKSGRLADTTINSIVNKSKVSDFQWDPYDEETIAAACDDGTVKIWKIPETGLDQSLEVPDKELRGHNERLYCLKYHPYAKNVLATASFDRSIKIWNVDTGEAIKTLTGHTDVIFSICWSHDGTRLASISKDGYIRIYEPLSNEVPILEEKCGPTSGSKAARIEWVINSQYLLVSGFGKGNLRQIFLFDSENLSLLQSEDINQSPSLLIPYYDSDINVLYLYAKGEETVYLYEIQETEPYFQVLSPYKPEGLHYAIAFLPKLHCDIKAAEISKAYRLTKDNRIERISFFVPRVKLGFFQDDIFPDTLDRRNPYVSASEWFSGVKVNLRYINLQPENMQKLTEILAIEAQQPPKPSARENKKFSDLEKKGDLYNPENLNDDERKIISSMLQRATLYYKEKSDEEDNSDWETISMLKHEVVDSVEKMMESIGYVLPKDQKVVGPMARDIIPVLQYLGFTGLDQIDEGCQFEAVFALIYIGFERNQAEIVRACNGTFFDCLCMNYYCEHPENRDFGELKK